MCLPDPPNRSRSLAVPFNLLQMLSQPLENVIALPLRDFTLHLIERKMNDVMVMQFSSRQLVTEFQPNVVQQIDFFRRKPRRVRPQIENLLLSRRRENLQRHSRTPLRHALPRQSNLTSLLRHAHFR